MKAKIERYRHITNDPVCGSIFWVKGVYENPEDAEYHRLSKDAIEQYFREKRIAKQNNYQLRQSTDAVQD